MINTFAVALDAIFKASGANIRLHGADNVPNQPVVYVVNHFTRLETIMMPYIIKRYFKKYPVSLADKSFFVGRMGEVMEKCGAISTKDPNRNNLMVNALLNDAHPVIIFPEGRMIKDKKIFEKGKYLIRGEEGIRPPHTGAAHIALQSQFIREELRLLRQSGNQEGIVRIAAHFGFHPTEADSIISRETFVVPVNITYYPVRAHDNAIGKMVEKFVEDVSVRFREEIAVEGSMVTEGVDIDINFGKPIRAGEYLQKISGFQDALDAGHLYFDLSELKNPAAGKKIYVEMMNDYMRAIYEMTTVNHDHLASYILTKYRKRSFAQSDFKNRIYLAIELLRKSGSFRYHPSLDINHTHLLTDDCHDNYESFVKEASANQLIKIEEGVITINKERFNKEYEFHTLRRDNILEVLRNEVEPLRSLTTKLDYLMFLPAFFVRRRIKNHFLELDIRIFEEDYKKYYIDGESKPKNIGVPFYRSRFWRRRGVILVHGYMAAPEEIRPLAEYLFKNGYDVYGARMKGHGTAPQDLAEQDWQAWYDAVNRAYIVMKNSLKSLAIVGFSTGAGIALLQAANKPGQFFGVVSINGPIRLQNPTAKFSSVVVSWNKLLSKFNINKGKMEFVANDPENPHINYFHNPVRGVYELEKLMKHVKDRLNDIESPTLVIQGSADPVVNPESGLDIFTKLGAKNKRLISIAAEHHGILRGKNADDVNKSVMIFLDNLEK